MARPNESQMDLIVLGVERVVILKFDETEPHPQVRVHAFPLPEDHSQEVEALHRAVAELAGKVVDPGSAQRAGRAGADAHPDRGPVAAGLPARLDDESGAGQGAGAARGSDPRRGAAPDARLPDQRIPGAATARQDRHRGPVRDEQAAARVPAAPAVARHPAGTGREGPAAGRNRVAARAPREAEVARGSLARKRCASSRGWSGCHRARPITR